MVVEIQKGRRGVVEGGDMCDPRPRWKTGCWYSDQLQIKHVGCECVITQLNSNLSFYNINFGDLFVWNMNVWSWSPEASVMFLVASLRKMIDNIFLAQVQPKSLWIKVIPGKANLLFWRVRLGKLPTRRNLSNRGVGITSTLCPICNASEETENHLMFECSSAKELWHCCTSGGPRFLHLSLFVWGDHIDVVKPDWWTGKYSSMARYLRLEKLLTRCCFFFLFMGKKQSQMGEGFQVGQLEL